MHLLINLQKSEDRYLPILAHELRSLGHTAVSSYHPYTSTELIKKAKLANCQAIVCINPETLNNLVPGKRPTLDAYRGSLLRHDLPILILNPLAHINTIAHGRFLLQKDLSKLKLLGKKPMKFTFEVLDSIDKMDSALAWLEDCILISHDIETITINQPSKKEKKELNDDYSEDIEGLGGDTLISCCGWSALHISGSIRTFVLPLVDFGVDHFLLDSDYQYALETLRRINSLKIPKVMHNGMYDATHLIVYHAEPKYWTLDTMALHHAEFAELPKSLDFVASLHLHDYIYWKDQAEAAHKSKDIRGYWLYNASDCFNTLRVCLSQLINMPQYARVNFANKFKLVYPSLYCNFEGFLIDQNKREELRKEAVEAKEAALKLLRVYVADNNFNPGSWQQVEKYIYRVFGAKKPKIGKSKSCTDEKNLLAVAEQHPLLALLTNEILVYKGNQKGIGTYFDFMQREGRLLYSLDPFGTETGRMACRSSSFWCGTQVQNIPSYAKPMLIADEGFELDEDDNSQSEARCTAYCAEETNLIEALENKEKDFYKTLGFLFFGIPYENVTIFFRNKVLKKIVHGTNYMMGAKTFIENVGVSVLHEASAMLGYKIIPDKSKTNKEVSIMRFASLLLDKYHDPFPNVRKWYNKLKVEVMTTGMLKSPLGHVRRFFGDIAKDHNMLRSVVAHQPQNLSVEILNRGFWRIYKELVTRPKAPLKVGDYRMKAQIHDSILGQHRIELREIILKRKLELMDNPIEVYGRTLRIPVDTKIGMSWAERKELDDGTIINENGCVKYKHSDKE